MTSYKNQTKNFEMIIKLNKQFKKDIEILRKIEDYENYSVSNFGKVRNNKTMKTLKPAIDGGGYYKVCLSKNNKQKTSSIHRLVAFAFLTNPKNKNCVDHKNNDKLNNHINNLRYATYQENNQNSSMRSDNTSGTKGVSFNKRDKKWEAKIRFNNKQIHLGSFETIEEAQEARVAKAKELFKDFINIVEL